MLHRALYTGCMSMLFLTFMVVQSYAAPDHYSSTKLATVNQYVPGQMLVRYRQGVSKVERASFRDRRGLTRLEGVLPGLELVRVGKGRSLQKAIGQARQNKDVLRAERNSIYRVEALPPPSMRRIKIEDHLKDNIHNYFQQYKGPNDPVYLKNKQWSLKNTGKQYYSKETSLFGSWDAPESYGKYPVADADIDAPEAWEMTTGSKDVVVAVVDTGLEYSHKDLKDNIWKNPGESGGGKETNGKDDDKNGYVDDFRGWDFSFNDNDPMDKPSGWEFGTWLSHGTLVAGVIGAKGNNATDIAGINWDVKLMPVRAMGATGTEVGMIKALDYAASMGADVVNMSWGTGDPEFAAELNSVIEKYPDTLFVAAAGNNGSDHSEYDLYPCDLKLDNVICTAATGSGDELSYISDYGYFDVDIAAPGEEIYSTNRVAPYGSPGLFYLAFGSASDVGLIGDQIEKTGGVNDSWGDGLCCGVGELSDSPAADQWPDEAKEFVNYKPNTNSWAMLPELDLEGSSCTISVNGQWDLADDKVLVEASKVGTTKWQKMGQLDGHTPGDSELSAEFGKWVPQQPPPYDQFLGAIYNFGYKQSFNLTGFNGKKVNLRLRLVSNVSKQADGIYINQLIVLCDKNGTEQYQKGLSKYPELFEPVIPVSGTSIAAPHVTGVAALVHSVNPDIQGSALKSVLMGSVDKKSNLEDWIKSGGRLNAEKAVKKALPYTFKAGWFTDGKATGIAVNNDWFERVYLSYPVEDKVTAGQQKLAAVPYSYEWETWAEKGSGPGEVDGPNDISLDSGGSVYVSDAGNSRVQRYSSDGEYLTETAFGLVKSLKGIGGAGKGGVYVADQGQFGSLSGRISSFKSPFDPYDKKYDLSKLSFDFGWTPNGLQLEDVAVYETGSNLTYIYALDGSAGKVRKYQRVGNNAKKVVEWGGLGSLPGKLKGPQGIAVDGTGFVYVADTLNDRVQVFDPDGSLFTVIKGWGIEKPMAVAVTDDEVFVLHQTVNKKDAHQVSVFKQSNQ